MIPSSQWVRVVDISRNQGAIDFVKMYAAGVRKLIIRVSHGTTTDDHFAGYYQAALAAGFRPEDIAFYTFVNPKRCSGSAGAAATLDAIRQVVGHTRVGYMLDVENYKNESPNVGSAPVFGPAFAAHIREHIATVHAIAPAAFTFGYSNLAYWNGPIFGGSHDVWVGDDQLASEIEWLPARYPAYSDVAYAHYGYPPGPDGWPDWAFKAQPAGPFPPRGGKAFGWQFSAGFNHQGPVYGATSRDLDLNIVLPDAWARWTGTTVDPQPPPLPTPLEDQMNYYVVTGANARFIGTPSRVEWTGPGSAKVDAALNTQLAAGNLVQVDLTGGPNAFAATFLAGPLPVGDSLHMWTGDEFAALLPKIGRAHV